jgi:hypothetical protein
VSDESHRPAGSRDSLPAALEVCERSLRPDGAGGRGVPEGEESAAQWRALRAHAVTARQILTPDTLPGLKSGGQEHDVLLHERSGRWIKATKPWLAGYTVEILAFEGDAAAFLESRVIP